MVTPGVVRAIFAMFMVVWVIAFIGGFVIDVENRGRFLLIMLFVPFIVRVWLEAVLILFMIYERLCDIDAKLSAPPVSEVGGASEHGIFDEVEA